MSNHHTTDQQLHTSMNTLHYNAKFHALLTPEHTTNDTTRQGRDDDTPKHANYGENHRQSITPKEYIADAHLVDRLSVLGLHPMGIFGIMRHDG